MEDVTGQRFGKLTALEGRVGREQPVRCDCGTISVVNYYNLTRLHTITCGCLKKLPRPEVGDTFGSLTLTDEPTALEGHRMFQCSCGNRTALRVSHARTGIATSCGKCSGGKVNPRSVLDELFYEGLPITEHARRLNIKPKEMLMRLLKPSTVNT